MYWLHRMTTMLYVCIRHEAHSIGGCIPGAVGCEGCWCITLGFVQEQEGEASFVIAD